MAATGRAPSAARCTRRPRSSCRRCSPRRGRSRSLPVPRQQMWQIRQWPPSPWQSSAPCLSICPSQLDSRTAALHVEGALLATRFSAVPLVGTSIAQQTNNEDDTCCWSTGVTSARAWICQSGGGVHTPPIPAPSVTAPPMRCAALQHQDCCVRSVHAWPEELRLTPSPSSGLLVCWQTIWPLCAIAASVIVG
jgi:hypothetical protein